MVDVSYRIIADHVRCLAFALTDYAVPSNEGRGFVLRRMLRRGVFHGWQYFDMHEPFMCDLVEPLVDLMANTFPELRTAHAGDNVKCVADLIREEEVAFFRTLVRVKPTLQAILAGCQTARLARKLPMDPWRYVFSAMMKAFIEETGAKVVTTDDRSAPSQPEQGYQETVTTATSGKLFRDSLEDILARPGTVPGRIAFLLHATYGCPIDLTVSMAEKRGLTVDIDEYERLTEEARGASESRVSDIHWHSYRWARRASEIHWHT